MSQPNLESVNMPSVLKKKPVMNIYTMLLIIALVSLLLGPWMIRRLQQFQIGQQIREEGPASHHAKKGTPTMGGAMILIAIVFSTILWSDLENMFVWVVLFVTLAFGVIGYVARKTGYHVAAILIGVILGPLLETYFLRALKKSDGDIMTLFSSDLGNLLWVMLAISLLTPVYLDRRRRKAAERATRAPPTAGRFALTAQTASTRDVTQSVRSSAPFM